jgi:hypothetical protein
LNPGSVAALATAAPVAAAAPGDGSLTRVKGKTGCVAAAGGSKPLRALRAGCGRARALRDPYAIVVSADGRHVYVGSSGGIAAFARDGRTGALRQLQGSAGCVSARRGAGCGAARGSGFGTLALGPGGRFLYAGTSAGLSVFRRNARTGRLVQLLRRRRLRHRQSR